MHKDEINYVQMYQLGGMFSSLMGLFSATPSTPSKTGSAEKATALNKDIGAGLDTAFNSYLAISNANQNKVDGVQSATAAADGVTNAIGTGLSALGPWGAVAGTALKLVNGVGGSLMNNNATAKAAKAFTLNDDVAQSSSYGGVTAGAQAAKNGGQSYRKAGLFGKLFTNTNTLNSNMNNSNYMQNATDNVLKENKLAQQGAASSTGMFADRTNNSLYNSDMFNNGSILMGKKGAKLDPIHIKKSHEGKFTEYKARTGETTEEALHSKDAKVRKMANFAKNAKAWKHQQGGTLAPKDYMMNYINSPEYKERLALTGKGTQPISNEDLYNTHYAVTDKLASRALAKPQSNYLSGTIPGVDIRYGTNNVILNPEQATASGASLDEIKSHELSHLQRKLSPIENGLFSGLNKSAEGAQALNQYNQSGKLTDMNTFISNNKNTFHDQRPDENKADLDALRYNMYKSGIYDTSKGDLTLDTLNKALANPTVGGAVTTKRLLENYKPADLVQLNNTVAANTSTNNAIPMAQGGAKLAPRVGGKSGLPSLASTAKVTGQASAQPQAPGQAQIQPQAQQSQGQQMQNGMTPEAAEKLKIDQGGDELMSGVVRSQALGSMIPDQMIRPLPKPKPADPKMLQAANVQAMKAQSPSFEPSMDDTPTFSSDITNLVSQALSSQLPMTPMMQTGGTVMQRDATNVAPSALQGNSSYDSWHRSLPQRLQETNDYDLEGYYAKHGPSAIEGDQHLTDEFKKPNHVTFSNESKYSTDETKGGEWKKAIGGQWEFHPSDWNIKNVGLDSLQKYFKENEPNSKLVLPVTSHKEGGKFNVIVRGKLHAHRHELKDSPDFENASMTGKGVPVVSMNDGELQQHAEVERDELILHKELTMKLEELMKDGSDEALLEAGKMLATEIVKNTVDSDSKILKNA